MIGKLSHEQIDEVLHKNLLGRIGCAQNNKSYIVPVNYVYDGKHIIGHSVGGMKIDIMRRNPQVCFEVDEVKDFTNWRSVIVWGQYQEITGEREQYEAMKLFVDKMLKMKISETAVPPELSADRIHPRSPGNIRPFIYRIVITERSGRYEKD
jgi:nitroimidazol reductase NimA-like FMN-containing flavoprotein (pyridoxamine 5'-phosphate oxidase superfamily)